MNITKKMKKEFIDAEGTCIKIQLHVIRFDYVVVVYWQCCIVTLYRCHKPTDSMQPQVATNYAR